MIDLYFLILPKILSFDMTVQFCAVLFVAVIIIICMRLLKLW